MSDSENDEELSQFLFEHVETHEQLQTLLLLHKEPANLQTAEAISAALNVPLAVVLTALKQLCQQGLVQQDGAQGFRYAAKDETLKAGVERLVEAYDQNWSTVLRLLSTNAIRRIRTSVIGTFSDAFVLKGRK